jgi:hypothetical protein
MFVSLGPTLQALAGEREHVDQPAGAAGDVQGAKKGRRLRVGRPAGLGLIDGKLEQWKVNERPGDDVAVALDYRTDPADPRVVASDFWTEHGPCSWRQVTLTFSAFVAALDL